MSGLVDALRSWRDRIAASRFWPMLWKEFIQMRRDRLTFAIMTGLPAMQLILFGYAIQTDVRDLKLVVYDASRTSESRLLAQTLENTDIFRIVGDVASDAEVRKAIETGRAAAALIVPPDYGRRIARGEPAHAQLIVDAADPQSSAAALSGAQLAATARGVALTTERLGAAPVAPVDLRVRPWYNPAQRSAIYIVPGILGVLLTITMTLITSTAIVRERERGTLEQLIVTPIGKTSLMLGKIVPFALVGYVQMSVVLALGYVLFAVPVRGSLMLLGVMTLPFIIASLGVGLLISTVARSQVQAMQLSFFYMLPNILLSGFMFPREAMPAPAQWIGNVLPLTYYLKVLRGIMLKDIGIDALWPLGVWLTGFAVVLLAISVRRFSKTIE